MGSRLENLSDEKLIKYLKYARKVLGSEELDSPLDLYAHDKVVAFFTPFGGNYDRLDVEYLFYLLKYNDPGSEEINRPEIEYKDVTWTIQEIQTVDISYTEGIETYIPDDLDESYLETIQEEGEIDPYEWDPDSEVIDSQYKDSWWYID